MGPGQGGHELRAALVVADHPGQERVSVGPGQTTLAVPPIGPQCLGAGQAAVAETLAARRGARGLRPPALELPGAAFPLAEAETLIEAARLLCYQTLWRNDRGLPHTAQATMGT
jgi:cyclohexanecarboxyl-CoA dehydrogenase